MMTANQYLPEDATIQYDQIIQVNISVGFAWRFYYVNGETYLTESQDDKQKLAVLVNGWTLQKDIKIDIYTRPATVAALATEPQTAANTNKMNYTVRSEAELNALKADWLDDPCWDIEETEGFEVWHDDLLAWRKEIQAEDELNERERIGMKTADLGINAALLKYIEQLERRIAALEAAK